MADDHDQSLAAVDPGVDWAACEHGVVLGREDKENHRILRTVQAVMLIGLADVDPASNAVSDLVASMLADAEAAATNPKTMKKASRASAQWMATNPQLESWIENCDDVTAAIKGKRKIEDRIVAIMKEVLEPKRGYWVSVLAWSAFAQRGDGNNSDWLDMAVVGGENGIWTSADRATDLPLHRRSNCCGGQQVDQREITAASLHAGNSH